MFSASDIVHYKEEVVLQRRSGNKSRIVCRLIVHHAYQIHWSHDRFQGKDLMGDSREPEELRRR